MVALPRHAGGRKLTWKVALLPLLAIIATAALELALGGSNIGPSIGAVTAAQPPSGAQAMPPPASKASAPFSAPAGVAVAGATIYISDVATSTIWSRNLVTGAETLIAGSL